MTAQDALPSQLRLAVLHLTRRLRQQVGGQITASQLSALAAMAAAGEISLGALAGIERIAPPSMTRIAARLEELGLVERRTDPADRRVARVAITAEGRTVLEEIRTRRDAYLAVRVDELDPDAQQVLARAVPLLERLATEDR